MGSQNRIKRLKGEVGRESGEGCEEWLERPLEARLSLWSQLDPSLRQGSALQER